MDHAFSMRAPQTGLPPSPAWSLYQISSSSAASGFAHYRVLDAVGVAFGTISEWVLMPGGQAAGLVVEVRGTAPLHRYLIPLGYVTGVDPRHGTIHLREITRRTLPQKALRWDAQPPPAEVLSSFMQEAPPPRPETRSIFRDPSRGPFFSPSTPVVVPVKRAREASRLPAPQPAMPVWQPLQALGDRDASAPPRWE